MEFKEGVSALRGEGWMVPPHSNWPQEGLVLRGLL